MFCPGCGLKEERVLQYCRACGTDLGTVRDKLAQPDGAANSLASAREEVARALAARIQQAEWWQTQTLVAEMAKLFESPEERRLRRLHAGEAARLRRVRAGVITSAVGLAEILFFMLLSIFKHDILLLAAPGVVVLLIGIAVLLNGMLFTLHKMPRKGSAPDDEQVDEASLGKLIERFGKRPAAGDAGRTTDSLGGSEAARPSLAPASVTEQTTRHLSSES